MNCNNIVNNNYNINNNNKLHIIIDSKKYTKKIDRKQKEKLEANTNK